MARKHRKKPAWQRDLARERIATLFDEAGQRFDTDPDLSHRYAELARKISMRYKVRLTPQQRRQVCRDCGHFLVAGKNLRVRLTGSKASYTCLDCRSIKRYPYLREQKAKREAQSMARRATQSA